MKEVYHLNVNCLMWHKDVFLINLWQPTVVTNIFINKKLSFYDATIFANKIYMEVMEIQLDVQSKI